MENEKKWYVVHTYSGYEAKVKANLESKIKTLGMDDMVSRIIIPTQDNVTYRNGKKKMVTRKIFPGYVIIEMIVNERSWYVIRNTPGVTGFVGEGTKPIPLSEDEVNRILGIETEPQLRPKFDMQVGQSIYINSGSFENFPATIVSIDKEHGKIQANVTMFGRETTVELNFDQVDKIE